MKKMRSNATERMRITHPFVFWDDAFTPFELASMERYCSELQLEGATVSNDEPTKGAQTEVDESIRQSDISFLHPNNDTRWMFNRILEVMDEINDHFYGFDLQGLDYLQYTEYNQPGHKYVTHMDMMLGPNNWEYAWETRKLSFTLILNDPEVDFTGGDFICHPANPVDYMTVPQKKGRIIAFPSFMFHAVQPIITGCRKSIVGWCIGPKFK